MARHPLRTSLMITGCKAAAADYMVQRVIQKRQVIDKKRLALFGLFGTVYQGGFQYFVLNRACEWMWPGTAMRMVANKVSERVERVEREWRESGERVDDTRCCSPPSTVRQYIAPFLTLAMASLILCVSFFLILYLMMMITLI
tara:strand:- start:256 stop:684 length:429 start_codon:yes stop_codon:yes gene_type:complete